MNRKLLPSSFSSRWGLKVFALALLVTAALATIAIRRHSLGKGGEVVLPPPIPTFVHVYEPGRKLSYLLDYQSTALLDGTLEHRSVVQGAEGMVAGAGETLTVSTTFAGTYNATVLDRAQDGSAHVLASLHLREARVTASNRTITLPPETFAALTRGFVIAYGADGEVRGVALEEGAPAIAVRLAHQVVGFLQVVAKPHHGTTWEEQEVDSLGKVHAHYDVLSDEPSRPGDQLLRKRITRTELAHTGGALARLISRGQSTSDVVSAYEVSPSRGILVEAAGSVVSEQLLGDLRVGLSDNRLQVQLESESVVEAADLARMSQERSSKLSPLQSIDPARVRAFEQQREHQALITHVDLAAILSDARTHPPAPQSPDAATYASLLLAAVDASPESRALLERTLTDVRTSESAFLPIAHAFSEDGSPEAQAALIRVIRARPMADPARSAALFSLSRVEKPTAATLAWLEALVDAPEEPWSRAALLCLGRVAGQVAANEPQRGREVLLRLLQRVQQSANEDARALALLAVGNAGAPELERELTPWTSATSVIVRRAAISAYRLIPTVSARDAMLQALATDQDPSVRYAALEGVLLRPPDDAVVDAVAERLEHDVDESVKKPCASRLIGLCQRSQRACRHIARLKVSGDDWTRDELIASQK